jgi:hypothetical protein
MMSELVFAHQGSIDKFLGDGLMAVFGLPLTSSHDATNAAMCALEITRQITVWNEKNAPHNPMRVAIGIHYGDVIQGDIGTDKRLEFTVIGDAVNLATGRRLAFSRASPKRPRLVIDISSLEETSYAAPFHRPRLGALPFLSARGSETISVVRCARCTTNIGRVRTPSDEG